MGGSSTVESSRVSPARRLSPPEVGGAAGWGRTLRFYRFVQLIELLFYIIELGAQLVLNRLQ